MTMISTASARVHLAHAYLFDLDENFVEMIFDHVDAIDELRYGPSYWHREPEFRLASRELRMTMLMGGPL